MLLYIAEYCSECYSFHLNVVANADMVTFDVAQIMIILEFFEDFWEARKLKVDLRFSNNNLAETNILHPYSFLVRFFILIMKEPYSTCSLASRSILSDCLKNIFAEFRSWFGWTCHWTRREQFILRQHCLRW